MFLSYSFSILQILARPSSLTAGPETRVLGWILRPYVRYSGDLIWATPGLDFLSEDYVLLNQLGNNTMNTRVTVASI